MDNLRRRLQQVVAVDYIVSHHKNPGRVGLARACEADKHLDQDS
jgi:hypothetical protein